LLGGVVVFLGLSVYLQSDASATLGVENVMRRSWAKFLTLRLVANGWGLRDLRNAQTFYGE
jgi:hypothetical protein